MPCVRSLARLASLLRRLQLADLRVCPVRVRMVGLVPTVLMARMRALAQPLLRLGCPFSGDTTVNPLKMTARCSRLCVAQLRDLCVLTVHAVCHRAQRTRLGARTLRARTATIVSALREWKGRPVALIPTSVHRIPARTAVLAETRTRTPGRFPLEYSSVSAPRDGTARHARLTQTSAQRCLKRQVARTHCIL